MKNKNSMKNKYTILIICIILICLIIYFLYFSSIKKEIPAINKKTNSASNTKTMEVIISRYNEDLKWTLEAPFNNYKYIVYNKGDNEEYEKTNVLKSYKIKNQGKCDHTYLYHIVHNYHSLSDIVIFLPGCINESYFKLAKTKLLLNLIKEYNEAFFIVDYKCKTNILDENYYFKLDNYKSMSKSNLEKNNSIEFRKSKVRPYGKWYSQNFDYLIQNVTLFGIFSFNKKDIYNHNKEVYYKYMKSLEGAINDELSHYFEKSWEAVVYPLNNTYVLNYTNSITNLFQKAIVSYIQTRKEKFTMDLSASPLLGPMYWNIIYFINKYTYIEYKINNNK